jgi:hypothetical protein
LNGLGKWRVVAQRSFVRINSSQPAIGNRNGDALDQTLRRVDVELLEKYLLTRMFHKPCCWSKTTGLVDVRRPG